MADQEKPGYTDTPIIPGTTWRVHDADRPQPPIVTPGEGAAPPSDAVVLFDGAGLDGWTKAGSSEPAGWKVENGCMEVVPKSGNIASKEQFGDCQLHLEFMSPAQAEGDSQGRGNSGVFLMGRYEIQVLDCYDNPTYADGTTGGIYGQTPPMANACRKPGEWQTYDIVWSAPRFLGDGRVVPARVTVLLNGVVLHHAREIMGPTTHRKVTSYSRPHPETGPLVLQDHNDPVRFRNIWCRPLVGYDRA